MITNIGEHKKTLKSTKGIALAKSEIIEDIIKGGTIILNRDDKYFNYLFEKAKIHKLKISTFGKHIKSDVRLKKIKKIGALSHVFVYIKNQPIDFKIKDLNIHNVLSSLAVLKELKVDISKKLKINLKFMTYHPEGRGQKISYI